MQAPDPALLKRALAAFSGKNPQESIQNLIKLYARGGVEIVFYIRNAAQEAYLRSTAEALRGRRCQWVLHPDAACPAALREEEVLRIDGAALGLLPCRLFVTSASGQRWYAMPWLGARRVNLPHSLTSLHMSYPAGAYDDFDLVLCAGPHQRRELEAMDRRRGVERPHQTVGYGKLDLLLRQRAQLPRRGDGPPRVILAPSWGEGNVLKAMGLELTEALLARGWEVVVRPHPAALHLVRPLIEALERLAAREPRFTLDRSPDSGEEVLGADVMISDYSGVAYEFAFVTRRPVVFVNTPLKMLNPRYGELGIEPMEITLREQLGVLVEPTIEAIVAGVSDVLQRREHFQGRIQDLTPDYLTHPTPEGCAQAAAAALEALLDA